MHHKGNNTNGNVLTEVSYDINILLISYDTSESTLQRYHMISTFFCN